MSPDTPLFLVAAASLAAVHTLLGPDHYLPFIAMGKARGWPLRRTLATALACGTGHIVASLGLAGVAILFGRLAGLEIAAEPWRETRSALAAWLLLGFGVAYAAWGLRQAKRGRVHTHWHAHADGTVHSHPHAHRAEHAHVHEAPAASPGGAAPWVLFVVFVLGPCEPLIPLLLAPAAAGDPAGLALVALTFGLCTVGTLVALVALGFAGLGRLAAAPRFATLPRYAHAAAGLTIAACGLAIHLGL